jgi:hypothetical protein
MRRQLRLQSHLPPYDLEQVSRVEEKLKKKSNRHHCIPQALQSTTHLNCPPLTTVSLAGIKRKMPPKMRLNSKQAHAARKESAKTKLHNGQKFKKATQLCAEEARKPKEQRKSVEQIVRESTKKKI